MHDECSSSMIFVSAGRAVWLAVTRAVVRALLRVVPSTMARIPKRTIIPTIIDTSSSTRLKPDWSSSDAGEAIHQHEALL